MNKGVSVSTGVSINGSHVETETGRMGADDKKYTTLSSGGTVFYILGGITMITSIVIAVKNKD